MRAARFAAFGDLDHLAVVDVPPPRILGEHQALVRVEASSINPSDVKNVAGAMSQTTLPRIPGRDYAGVVERGPADWLGAEVWGTGGDVGFTRDGAHAEIIAVPVASLRRKPARLSFDEAASVGVNFMAAWCGLIEAADLQASDTLVIVGAGGGVGSAAAQIASRVGARIIGVTRDAPHPEAPIRAAAERIIVGPPDLAGAVRDATGGRGASVVLDLVGGALFEPALRCLAPRGRLVAISAGDRRAVSFDLADFYHNESRLLGVDTLQRDLAASALVLDLLAPCFEAGTYRPAPIAEALPLAAIREGYRQVASGTAGRVVLRPQA